MARTKRVVVTPDPPTDSQGRPFSIFARISVVPPAAGIGEAVVTLDLLDAPGGGNIDREAVVELMAFNDADGVVPAVTAQWGVPTEGSVLVTESGMVKLRTTDGGTCVLPLVDSLDETVYLTALTSPMGPVVHCEGSVAVTFLPPA